MKRNLLIVAATVLGALSTAHAASGSLLGRIEFPTTGPKIAQQHFLRGMLAMHSFWYDEALDEFRAATKVAPSFAMGYWGEALTYYHPVWESENLVASRAAMAKIPVNAPLSDRERGFIDAAKILFGDGDRETRWQAYASALAKLHDSYPKDDEAATLYSVALLGTRKRGHGFRPFAEAAAVSLGVLAHNPDHPGAAHYVIHAFDDPEHAVLALPAARRYAQIAPEASHAQHMPSHIFVQLGMWREAQASNEAAWAASVSAAKKRQHDSSYYDFHSLAWLMSISFERGQRRHAEEVLQRGRDALTRTKDPDLMPLRVGEMASEYLLTTNDWARSDELLAPLATVEASVSGSAFRASTPGCACHVKKAATHAALQAQALLAFTHGQAAAVGRNVAQLESSRQALVGVLAKMDKEAADDWRVSVLILDSQLAELRNQPKTAIDSLRKAIALDEAVPPSGPAGAVTPRERLGELLLRQHRPADALKEFRQSLDSHPRRSRSLLDAATAAGLVDPKAARDYFSQLAANWTNADQETVGLSDARAAAETAR